MAEQIITDTDPDVYSIDQVADRMGIAHSTALDHIRRGIFPFPVLQLGKRMVVSRAAYERILQQGQAS